MTPLPIIAGAGFGMIGLPYAVLWGFFAGVARFVPYLGFVLGLAGPLLMSLAVFDGWNPLMMVIGLFVCLELLAGMLIEPLIYGKGIGVSEVALLIMIAFWTWLWGAVGLLLATPLTVCLMVISKSVPNLKFISVLLNHEPALDVPHIFYHRLIAQDEAEVRNIAEKFLSERSESELFEQLLVPTLTACRHDFERHKLTMEDQKFIFQTIRKIIGENEASPSSLASGNDDTNRTNGEIEHPLPAEKPWIVGFPAHDEADELALLMLARLLGREDWRMRVLSAGILSAEALAEAERIRPAVFCIGFLAPGATLPAHQLCKRLRSRFPDRPVILGHWGAPDQEKTRHRFAGLATEFGWTLAETKNQLVQYGQMEKSFEPQANDAWRKTAVMPFESGGWAAPEKIKINFIEQKL